MILVVGGTGDLGSRVVRQLLAHGGDQVRCLVRAGSDAAALRDAGVEVVAGDLTRPESLPAACDGADVVVASATAIGRILAGARRPSIREVDEIGMVALVDAAESAGVQRFVFVSYPTGPRSFGGPLEPAKIRVEERLSRSRMRRVVVRPDAFQEVHLGSLGRFDVAAGKVGVLGRGDNPRRWVAADDVAALVAAVAVEPDPPSEIDVGGPEALTRNEAVQIAERATGRQFKVQRLPRPVVRTGAALLPHLNDAVGSLFALGLMMDLQPVTWDDEPLTARGMEPRSATEWIELQAREARERP